MSRTLLAGPFLAVAMLTLSLGADPTAPRIPWVDKMHETIVGTWELDVDASRDWIRKHCPEEKRKELENELTKNKMPDFKFTKEKLEIVFGSMTLDSQDYTFSASPDEQLYAILHSRTRFEAMRLERLGEHLAIFRNAKSDEHPPLVCRRKK